MKRIEQVYIRAKHPEVNGGQDMVLQTVGMKLLGGVRFFNPDEKGEAQRRKFIETRDNPYHWAKANGYRVYVQLCGGLRSIYPAEMHDLREEIHTTLQEMAQFYAEQMTDGMKRHYADR